MKRRFSLQLLTFFLTSCLIVGSSAAITVYFYNQSNQILSSEFEERAGIIAKNLAFQAVEGIIVQDPFPLDILCKGVMEEKDLVYVLIYGKQKNILYSLYEKNESGVRCSFENAEAGFLKLRLPATALYSSRYLDIVKKVTDREEPDATLGYVRIGVSLENIVALKQRQIWNLLIIFALILGGSFIVSFWLVKMLTIPLQRLVDTMTQIIQTRNLDTKVRQSGCIREVDEIRIQFNEMIHQLRQSRHDLENHRDHLEELVEERTSRLKETQKELINKAVDSGRAQFSAMVLHNIGNAVTPVRMNIENQKKNTLEETCRYLSKCYQELKSHSDELSEYVLKDKRGIVVAGYMGDLIQELMVQARKIREINDKSSTSIEHVSQILSLQRAYAPSMEEMKERVDINHIVEDALRMQESSISKRHITIDRQLEKKLPVLLIERSKLMQVVVNFIKNALEAIDANAEETAPAICIKTFKENGRRGLQMTDTGCGVNPDDIEDLFRFGVSTKGSSGFGLYYGKSFVEANNGTLTLESDGIGQGATVSMVFMQEKAPGDA